MAPDRYRIFVNSTPLEAAAGERVIDVIARWDAAAAERLREGRRALADSRGVAIGIDTPVYAGAIFRVVSARPPGEEKTDEERSGDDSDATFVGA